LEQEHTLPSPFAMRGCYSIRWCVRRPRALRVLRTTITQEPSPMYKSATLTSVLLTACFWTANAAGQLVDSAGVDLLEAPVVYTLTNLHPDEARARLYAVNYQQPGLIPRCAEVRISRLRRNRMTFV